MKTLTIDELKDLINTNHCIFLYPKKKVFVISGCKAYIASEICINYYKNNKK
jgi:hypothetical protein